MTQLSIIDFQTEVLAYYKEYGRHDLPWRQPDTDGLFDPYRILVSELMLQQTQVSRVIPKFLLFTAAFPSFESLAIAPLADVLKIWSGLGYNRRAKFLLQTSKLVKSQYDGKLPSSQTELVMLPGIGSNTAGAIRAYAFNEPVVFIETNIRTVFIHHFILEQEKVADSALLPLIEASMLGRDTRSWYWALMDYGTYLKQSIGNVSRASTTYVKQSKFEGSKRQIRGKLLRILAQDQYTLQQLTEMINDERLDGVLDDLISEGFVVYCDPHYKLYA